MKFIIVFLATQFSFYYCQAQFGRVLSGSNGIVNNLDFGPRNYSNIDTPSYIIKPTHRLDYNSSSTQKFIVKSNRDNVIFSINQKKLIDSDNQIVNVFNDSLIDSESNTHFTLILPFKNHNYQLIGFFNDTGNNNLNSIYTQNIFASKSKRIYRDDVKNKTIFNDAVQSWSYGRINDSSYLVVIATKFKVHFYSASLYEFKFIKSIDLEKQIRITDTSTLINSGLQSVILNIKLSNTLKYFSIHYQEIISERIKSSPIYYTYEVKKKLDALYVFSFSLTEMKIESNKIVEFSENPDHLFFGEIFKEDIIFDPLDKYLYFGQIGKTNKDSVFSKRYSIDGKIIENLFQGFKNCYRFPFLTYQGFISFVHYDPFLKRSKLILLKNPSETIDLLRYSKSEFQNLTYFFTGPQNGHFVHNYLYIEPEIRQECKSRVKFHNNSNMNRGFTRFEYHLATDTAGKNWKVLQEFEPEYIYKTAGKYAYKVRGFCDDGYSEWYEDSVIIEYPERFDVLPSDTPRINYATVTNNKQIDINWAPQAGAYEYEVYKSNLFLGNTKNTKFTDSLSQEVKHSVKYQLVALDGCLHKSAHSKTVETIFLTARKDNSSAVQLQSAELEWNAYKNGTETAINYQTESAFLESNSWQVIHTGTTLIYRDNQFVNFGYEGKCYRIQGQLLGGFRSQSNEVCIPYNELVYIPSAFTPNGDGLNDAFEVHGNGISNVEMSIYNRWGEKIFTAEGKNTQWMPSNDLLSNQAYQYIIRCSYSNGNWDVFKGSIMVLK
jgi:gliding motility-associated-like protein